MCAGACTYRHWRHRYKHGSGEKIRFNREMEPDERGEVRILHGSNRRMPVTNEQDEDQSMRDRDKEKRVLGESPHLGS